MCPVYTVTLVTGLYRRFNPQQAVGDWLIFSTRLFPWLDFVVDIGFSIPILLAGTPGYVRMSKRANSGLF